MSTARDVHVGEPAADFPFEESVKVHFHDFPNLPQGKGVKVGSPKFLCAGHEWFLSLYPGGDRNARDGMMSVFLCSELMSKISVEFDIMVKKKGGDNFKWLQAGKIKFPIQNNNGLGLGWKDSILRLEILDESKNILNHGTLTFEVCIRPENDYYCRDAKPGPTLGENIFNNLFLDKESADVAFKVKCRVLHAHKAILKAQTPELVELAEPYDLTSPIPIKDVKPEIFEMMLKSVYGKPISVAEWKENSKEILDASGKYGFIQLKSNAEAWHVKNLKAKLTVDNAIDELLYADGKSCLLLKKAVMDFIIDNGEEVLESDSYEKLDESSQLRKEVMKAAFTSSKRKRDE
jgi:hypothetical protein